MNSQASIDAVARRTFEYLAGAFPVCCSSDEFYYFPQVRPGEPRWERWDLFSPDAVTDVVRKLSALEREVSDAISGEGDVETRIDGALLTETIRALAEQLSLVRPWERQPSFLLTVACVGLAEAMTAPEPDAVQRRASGLPAFLRRAAQHLDRVPAMFREIGLQMVADTRDYFHLLARTVPAMKEALAALEEFEKTLRGLPGSERFLLPPELLDRVVRRHLHCDLDFPEIDEALDMEIEEMRRVVAAEAGPVEVPPPIAEYKSMATDGTCAVTVPDSLRSTLIDLYRMEVEGLLRHCLDSGFLAVELADACPARVEPMPVYLSAIRAGSSYSALPGYPPRGGTFYLLTDRVPGDAQKERLDEFRMTCAHETYPGHHLLDASRLGHPRPARRPVERPLFYEGWACFAEEMMRRTGYFAQPAERMLVSRRRLRNAIRGKVDLGLQTGVMDLNAAAELLQGTSLSREGAMFAVRRYPLNPGYQLCYTLGLRRFLELSDRYGRENLSAFARAVLGQGEVDFGDLSETLRKTQPGGIAPNFVVELERETAVDYFLGYHSEWNLGSPGGWDYQRITQLIGKATWDSLLKGVDLDFEADFNHPLLNPLGSFVDMLANAHRDREGDNPGFIAVVAEEETLEDVGENQNLVTHLNRVPGLTSALMAPTELELSGGRVCYRGHPVSILFVDFNTNVLLDLHRKHDLKPLLTAVREKRVVNPRGTEPINSKAMFEVLTSPRTYGRFQEETVRRTPWTRRFWPRITEGPTGEAIPDLVEWTRARWEGLVLKPERGYSGIGVSVGGIHNNVDEIIENALKTGGYIVQQKVPLNLWTESMPELDPDTGAVQEVKRQTDFRCFFAPHGSLGFLSRFGGVPTNVGSGGGIQPLAVLPTDTNVGEATRAVNEAIFNRDDADVREAVALQHELAREHKFTYLLGPIKVALRPRFVTLRQLRALREYSAGVWADCVALEKMWLEGELDEMIDYDPEEIEIVRTQPWGGSPAIFASDGLFSFGAQVECE